MRHFLKPMLTAGLQGMQVLEFIVESKYLVGELLNFRSVSRMAFSADLR